MGLKVCAITAEIKKYKSIIKRKKKKHVVFLASIKSKLNRIEFSISKFLIDSSISHDEFILKNIVLKEYKKNERRNQKFKDLIGLSMILVYL